MVLNVINRSRFVGSYRYPGSEVTYSVETKKKSMKIHIDNETNRVDALCAQLIKFFVQPKS